MKLSEIYKFHAVTKRLGTAGQPTEIQFRAVRESGFEAVVNLALPTSDNALANEGSIVTGLGMSYVHIPVDFKAPTTEDFHAFCGVMQALRIGGCLCIVLPTSGFRRFYFFIGCCTRGLRLMWRRPICTRRGSLMRYGAALCGNSSRAKDCETRTKAHSRTPGNHPDSIPVFDWSRFATLPLV